MSLFYRIDVPHREMNGTQDVLANRSEFGLWRNLLSTDAISFHELAGRIKKYTDRYHQYKMPTEDRLGFAMLRLVQEGLVGMVNNGPVAVEFKKVHEAARIPEYKTPGAAAADVYSVEDCTIEPMQRAIISIGLSVAITPGYEIQVRPRSGLAFKHGITVLNSPGTIDSDYRGVCKVILYNGGMKPYHIEIGDRIAQFAVKKAPQARFSEVDELSDTERGDGGFGSTGV